MKMNLRWTMADVKRASKMGFALADVETKSRTHKDYILVVSEESKFRSDREAAEWVMECLSGFAVYRGWQFDEKTCRKAILICCVGEAR